MACFLVTGGAGFLGSHLVDALLRQGHLVRVLDDLSSGYRENLPRQIQFSHGGITDPTTVEEAFEGIDACFHLAAIASVVRSNREWLRTHEVNLTGTLNIFNQVRRLRHRREIPIVYASSAAIYGNCGTVPIGEDAPVAPPALTAQTRARASCMRASRARCTKSRPSDCGSSTSMARGKTLSPHIPA